jgi:adenosylcobinamide-phosphate synthase
VITSNPETVFWLLLIAFFVEVWVGYPAWLLRQVSHPIVWLGRLISALEANLNRGRDSTKFALGGMTLLLVLLMSLATGVLLQQLAASNNVLLTVIGVMTSSMFATRSLWVHIHSIANELSEENLRGARDALSHVVSRDTTNLDESEISSSALESLSENTSDAVTAPLFWCFLFGLPGLLAYKTINTLDSMWGYRNEQFEYFGKCSARMDDLANWIPARITALGIHLASRTLHLFPQSSIEAKSHSSPNAGWPEAAMAFGLGVRLGGNFNYGGNKTAHVMFNRESLAPDKVAITRGLRIYVITVFYLFLAFALFGAMFA